MDEMRETMIEEQHYELVRRAQTGDRRAFDELAGSVNDVLLANIRRRLGPELREKLDAEDVLQETLLRAFRCIEEFQWEGEKSFERWLGGIATNFILHSARRYGLRKHLRIVRDPEAKGVSPSRHQRREERLSRLVRSIDELNPEYRQVVRLSRLEGLKIEEIAERMGRSTGSVRNLLFRAMKQLRESFGDTESLNLPRDHSEQDASTHDD